MNKASGWMAFKAALTAPLSLLVIGGSVVASYFMSWSPLVLAAGAVVELLLMFSYMRDERFLNHLHDEIRDQEFAETRKELDRLFKEAVSQRSAANFPRDRIQRMRDLELSFWKEYQKSDVAQEEIAQTIMRQAVSGFQRFYELILKQMRISHVLESTSIYQIQREIERLKRQAQTAGNDEAAAQYRKAAGFKEQELRALEKAVQMLTLFNAHLDTLESALSTLRTRLVNTAVWGTEMFTDDLEVLTTELGALDQAIEEMMVWEKHTTK